MISKAIAALILIPAAGAAAVALLWTWALTISEHFPVSPHDALVCEIALLLFACVTAHLLKQ